MENVNSLFNRDGAKRLRDRTVNMDSERGQRLAGGLYKQFNELHSIDFYPKEQVERILLRQMEKEIDTSRDYIENKPNDLICFSPSGVAKCKRELIYKATKMPKDEIIRYPYQHRWTRNSSAVHGAVQRDLLYMPHVLDNPMFTVHMLEDGLPAWENNIKKFKQIHHNGQDFLLYGMMDGILEYKADGSLIGFEFKTKSTTIGCVGSYKMKAPAEEHILQCTAYSLLFDIDEFILMYESVAKDGWMKGKDAKIDFRTFYHKVTEEDKKALLDKLADVTAMYNKGHLPPKEDDKCVFCPYKTLCKVGADNEN